MTTARRKKRVQPRKYHYTIGLKLPKIIESGYIKLATAEVDLSKEKPAVFFSIDKLWEPTANKALRKDGQLYFLTTDEMIKDYSPLIRIEVKPEAAPYKWDDYVRLSGIDKGLSKGLEKSATKNGSTTDHFFISFKPVTKEQWLSIQILTDEKKWRIMSEDEIQEYCKQQAPELFKSVKSGA